MIEADKDDNKFVDCAIADDKDLTRVALEQNKSKKYHQPYIIQQKPIVGIGYSFGEGTREITNYRDETLYIPGIILE